MKSFLKSRVWTIGPLLTNRPVQGGCLPPEIHRRCAEGRARCRVPVRLSGWSTASRHRQPRRQDRQVRPDRRTRDRSFRGVSSRHPPEGTSMMRALAFCSSSLMSARTSRTVLSEFQRRSPAEGQSASPSSHGPAHEPYDSRKVACRLGRRGPLRPLPRHKCVDLRPPSAGRFVPRDCRGITSL